MAEINVGTVMTIMQIIDLAASKGVFVGKDLTAVGTVRQELEEIVQPLVDAAKKEEDDRRALEAAEKTQREFEEKKQEEMRSMHSEK